MSPERKPFETSRTDRILLKIASVLSGSYEVSFTDDFTADKSWEDIEATHPSLIVYRIQGGRSLTSEEHAQLVTEDLIIPQVDPGRGSEPLLREIA